LPQIKKVIIIINEIRENFIISDLYLEKIFILAKFSLVYIKK
jgi:hypothetical protein